MGKRNRRLSNYVKRQGGLSLILPTEGVPRSQEVIDWFVEQNDDTRFADAYLSWNNELAQMFSEVETFVTGCPRFDIYQKPYNSLIDSRETFFGKYNLDPRKGLILFTSSFPQAKFHYRGKEFNRQDWKDLNVTAVEGNPDEYAREEYEKLREYRLWIRIANNYYSDRFNIAVKPHPLEDIVEWQQFCDELSIPLLKGEYIFNAVTNSDLMIGRTKCLTHADAWLSGTMTIHALFDKKEDISGPAKDAINHGYGVTQSAWSLVDQIQYAIDIKDTVYAESEIKNEWWGGYLNPWGFSVPNSAQKVAKSVVQLIEEWNPEVRNIATEDWQRINRVIAQHNAENKVLKQDGLGHFGKTVTRDIVDDWLMRIREIS